MEEKSKIDDNEKSSSEKEGDKQYSRDKLVTLIAMIIVESVIIKYEKQKSNCISEDIKRQTK